MLLVLLPWPEGRADPLRLVEMALLTAIMAVGFGFELTSDEMLPLFYAASMQLALFFLLWLGSSTRGRAAAGGGRKVSHL